MIDNMGRHMAKGTLDLCPRGFGRRFRKAVPDFVVAGGKHVEEANEAR